jgi:hypothetical protein
MASAAATGMAADGVSVTGRVTNRVTGAPILRAHVRLTHWAEKGQTYGALTDDKGKYTFAQLPAGKYSFTADATGFEASGPIPGENVDSLELRDGDRRGDVDIALIPWGAISGRVVDAEGHPLQGIQVAALGLDGFVSQQLSDPRGEYRMPRLSPGRYRVRAAPEELHMPPEIRSDGTAEMRYASTYYPDSLTSQSAAPLEILPGVEFTGIDIRMARAPIVAVRGTLSGMEAGTSAFLDIRKVEPPGGPGSGRAKMRFGDQVNPDGSFVIWGLDPGTYLFVGESNAAGWQSAPVEVTVAGKDVNGVHIGMMRKLTISGRVVPADEGAQLPPVPPDLSLGQQKQISVHEVTNGYQFFAVVADDGTFHIDTVPVGRYSVQLSWGPYVQSMRRGATGIDGEILDLRDGSDAALTVNASSATGEIAGAVRNSSGPASHAPIVLLEEGTGVWPSVDVAGADGHYSFPNLRPGKYRLVGLDRRPAYALALGFLLFDYADIVETVDLGAGEHATRDLRQHDGK